MKTWTNKKLGKYKKYKGRYKYNIKTKRFFILEPIGFEGESKVFNSPQAAKAQGWVC